ncbi:MAG: rRNA maturation RNase YbeY [Cytophagales bacterium]|nr:rRNA maturation RNase YbeY [Cytophagales bacterium]
MIAFLTEDITFELKEKLKHKAWLKKAAKAEGFRIGELNYIFCSDVYLLDINQKYLGHDTLTDIVTFDNSEEPKMIEGDIFISIERVRENALKFDTAASELKRVMIHGLLHLAGYKDKDKAQKELMTLKENEHLKTY